MPSALHSVVVAVADLEAAVAGFVRLLERPIEVSPDGGSAVVGVGNTRLELRARSPLAGSAGQDGLDRLRLAFRPETERGFAAGPVASPTVPIELVAESESESEPEPGATTAAGAARPAAGPAPTEASSARPPATGIVGLDHVVIATRDPERTRAFLADALGLRLALDRSFPERGLRLLFFRVGGVTLEVASALASRNGEGAGATGVTGMPGAPASDPVRDAFHGLAWQVRDLDGTRARLEAAGFALSPIRPGHKPGTRVCSLRTPLCGVPTLLIEHPPRPPRPPRPGPGPGEGSSAGRH